MKMENDQEFRGKKLLVLGGITLACDIVRHAQVMGVYVVVADYDRNSPAKKIADKAVLIDALDVDAIVELCKLENIDVEQQGLLIFFWLLVMKYANVWDYLIMLRLKC